MFNKIIYTTALAAIVLSGCASDAANSGGGTANGGEPAQTNAPATETAASETAAVKTATDLRGGASVPAKRNGLTAADRAKFLEAIGAQEEAAGDSEFFLENLEKRLGRKIENAAMIFHALGGGKYLVEIMVGQGARTGTSVYALYQETGANKALAKALRLDEYWKENGKIVKRTVDEVVGNPYFDEKTKLLTVIAAGRGTGGCGSYAKYKFTGDRAETVEARYSPCGDDYETPPEKWEKLTLIAGERLNSEREGDSDAGEYEHIAENHAGVLENYLKNKPGLRPATPADYDRANPKLAANRQSAQSPHPYYVRGDFSGDGREDFAVILKSAKGDRAFNYAIFNAPFNPKNPQPASFGQADYRFVLHYNKKPEEASRRLYIGSYDSDDGLYIEPDGKGYKFVELLGDMP